MRGMRSFWTSLIVIPRQAWLRRADRAGTAIAPLRAIKRSICISEDINAFLAPKGSDFGRLNHATPHRIYADRAVGRDRDHWRVGIDHAAGDPIGPRSGTPHPMHSNMRQVGLAVIQYCELHHGWFPYSVHDHAASESWIYTIAPFLESVDAIRICPDDQQGKLRLDMKLTSYVMNAYVVDLDLVRKGGSSIATSCRLFPRRSSPLS